MLSRLTPSILISSIRESGWLAGTRNSVSNDKHQIRIAPLCCVRLRPPELARSQWLSSSTHWQHVQSIPASVGERWQTQCRKCAQQHDAESTATESQCSIAPELLLTAKSTRIVSSVAASATRNKFNECVGVSNAIQSTLSTTSIPPSEPNGSATRARSRPAGEDVQQISPTCSARFHRTRQLGRISRRFRYSSVRRIFSPSGSARGG